jgi:cell division protein FtsB
MTSTRVSRTPFVNQIALLVMGALIVYLVVDFGRQVVLSQQRHDELQRVEEQIATVVQKEEELKKQLDWAQSPEAAEAFAREQGWAKPGEVPVVLVESAVTPLPAEEPPPPVSHRAAGSPREAWLELFLGER